MENNLNNFVDVQNDVEVILGTTNINIEDFLNLEVNDVLSLNKNAGDPADIFVNKRIIGTGDIFVLNNKLAIRLQNSMNSENVIKYFFEEEDL